MATGIRQRGDSWEAWVYDKWTKKKIRKTFCGSGAHAAAKAWRTDATSAVSKRTLKAPAKTTVREAWEAWLAGASDGSVRTRSGDRYKPSVLRSYEASMRLRNSMIWAQPSLLTLGASTCKTSPTAGSLPD
jgi:hypothetical protein